VRSLPALPAGHYFLAIAYTQLQDGQKAETELKAVIQSSPNFVQAYTALAGLELAGGDLQSAVDHARQAVTLAPNTLEPRLLLVRAYIRSNEFKTAGSELETILKKSPGNAAALHHLGLLLAAQGNPEKAETQFEAAFKADPRQVDSLAALT